MPSSITWGVLLLAGLCCLLHDSQAKDVPETNGTSDSGYRLWEHEDCQKVSCGVTAMSIALYRKLARGSELGNVLFSPVSIAAALAMLSMGTKGDTHTQILKGLKLNLKEVPEGKIHECFQHLFHVLQQPSQRLRLTTGSSLFIKSDLKPTEKFVRNAEKVYHSDIVPVDFRNSTEAVKKINSHVEEKTQREIKSSVYDLEEDTALALVNYIFFQGQWNEEFHTQWFQEEVFGAQKQAITVPMVARLGRFYLQRVKRLSSWVLVDHYVNDIVAFFILPDPGKMRQLERRLTPRHLRNIQRRIDVRSAKLYFPRLSISGTYDLKKVLDRLGITKVFTKEAGLSGVTEAGPLRLSKAVHKAVMTFAEPRKDTLDTLTAENNWTEDLRLIFNSSFLIIIKSEFFNFPILLGKVVNPIEG